jgi:hypothetical protein
MKTHSDFWWLVLTPLTLASLSTPAADKAPPTFEAYLRETAVPTEAIDRFLRGPSWAQFDPELGYILGNYLPSDGMDKSTTICPRPTGPPSTGASAPNHELIRFVSASSQASLHRQRRVQHRSVGG